MFSKGAIFKFTYNQYGVFSHYQMALFYDVPQQIYPDRFWRIKMLVSPPTIKYDRFIYKPDLPKYHYIQIGFKEVSIGQAPEHIVFYYDLKCICCQYGFRHYVTGTIHGAMGDTYNCMVILVSDTKKIFSLWDRSQFIVILLCTRIMKNNIFVGPNNETVFRLKLILNQIT